MATVIAYVDGFNLYHGLRDKYRRRYLWLDLECLVQRLRPSDHVVAVRYFTALVLDEPAALARQRTYLDALSVHSGSTVEVVSVGLGDRLRHLPSEVSGGQQQRVAVARALVKEPAVLLADEPTGNLDEDTRDEIIGLLERLWHERGLTMVLVTHDSAVAARAQRVGLMRNGLLTVAQPANQPPGWAWSRDDGSRPARGCRRAGRLLPGGSGSVAREGAQWSPASGFRGG